MLQHFCPWDCVIFFLAKGHQQLMGALILLAKNFYCNESDDNICISFVLLYYSYKSRNDYVLVAYYSIYCEIYDLGVRCAMHGYSTVQLE